MGTTFFSLGVDGVGGYDLLLTGCGVGPFRRGVQLHMHAQGSYSSAMHFRTPLGLGLGLR